MILTDVAILFGVTIGLPLLGYAWQWIMTREGYRDE